VIRRACLAACLALGGCSNLTDEGGIAGLEVQLPDPLEVEVGQTISLEGRALDASGNPADVAVTWLTPDTTIVVSAEGQLTGRTGGSTGRVQAQAGALTSDFFTFTVRPRPDTLVLSPDSVLTVTADAAVSAPLVAILRSFAPDQPVSGASIVYTVIDPAFADPAARTVELLGGVLTLTAITGTDGTPATPVTVARVAGRTAPAAAIVTVSAVTATGTPVAGSGQQFRIQFQ
jgi:hypothetical protein